VPSTSWISPSTTRYITSSWVSTGVPSPGAPWNGPVRVPTSQADGEPLALDDRALQLPAVVQERLVQLGEVGGVLGPGPAPAREVQAPGW
jgi:hypothetical protein